MKTKQPEQLFSLEITLPLAGKTETLTAKEWKRVYGYDSETLALHGARLVPVASPAPKHTQEPWKSRPSIHGSEYRYVQIGKDKSYTTMELKPEDANRIVTCVNAMAGVSDPENALRLSREAFEEAIEEIRRLRKMLQMENRSLILERIMDARNRITPEPK